MMVYLIQYMLIFQNIKSKRIILISSKKNLGLKKLFMVYKNLN